MRFYRLIILMISGLIVLSAISCNPDTKDSKPDNDPLNDQTSGLTKEDTKGSTDVTFGSLSDIPQRIISISPSTTELLFEYGVGDRVIGATSPHNYPPDAENLETIGELTLDKEKIIRLNPDLIIGEKNLYAGQTDLLGELGIPVKLFDTRTIDDLWDDLIFLDGIFKDHKSEILRATIGDTFESIPAVIDPPKVAAIVSFTPLILAAGDSYFGNLIKAAGGELITDNTPGDYVTLSREDLILLDPHIILCTFDGIRDDLIADPTLENISAMRDNQIYSMDPDIVLRPTLRSISEGASRMKFLFAEK